MNEINRIKTSKKAIVASFVLLLALSAIPLTASAAQEERITVRTGDTWGKDGWNLSVQAIDMNAKPMFLLISLSYQGKKIGDAKIETGKTYTFKGRNPDGSEVLLFTIKDSNIFVGANLKAVRLDISWSIPENDVQFIEIPEESNLVKPETPVPTPTAQASPEAPGFEVVAGVIGILAVWLRLKK
ncbi:MAG: hypothetical protein FIB08_14280 [Candidatus Methanoperedens sp.]|nr:hypothetical protein [Candidatus Methanoperedens sp.]